MADRRIREVARPGSNLNQIARWAPPHVSASRYPAGRQLPMPGKRASDHRPYRVPQTDFTAAGIALLGALSTDTAAINHHTLSGEFCRRIGISSRQGKFTTRGSSARSGGVGQNDAAAFHGGIQGVDRQEGGRPRDAGRDRRAAAARGVVQFSSVGTAEGGAGRVAAGAGEEARTEAVGGKGEAKKVRRLERKTGQRQPWPTPARALSAAERTDVFQALCSPRFATAPPGSVRDAASTRASTCARSGRCTASWPRTRRSGSGPGGSLNPKPEVVARASNEVRSRGQHRGSSGRSRFREPASG